MLTGPAALLLAVKSVAPLMISIPQPFSGDPGVKKSPSKVAQPLACGFDTKPNNELFDLG